MNIQAYATTSDNTIGADAGITVRDIDTNIDLAVETVDTQLDGCMSWANTVMLDEAAADEILTRHGFERDSDWILSDGQYVADVTAV